MIKDRVASLLLALGGVAFIAMAFSMAELYGPARASVPLLLAALHGTLAVGALRGAPWARWLGMGLALFWVGFALLMRTPSFGLADPTVERWVLVLLHAPLPLCLARPDRTHPRTSVSLLVTGAAIAPTLIIGVESLLALEPRLLCAAACGLAAVGALGLARERTWGMLAVGLAGGALMLDGATSTRIAGGGDVLSLVGLLLVTAALPFAKPVARWFRG